MLQCLSFKSSSANSSLPTSPPMNNINSHPPLSPGSANSTEGTPQSSAQRSPVINLTREYTLAVQTNSYNEMWTRIHVVDHDQVQEEVEVENGELRLSQVLQPDRDCVEEALRHSRPSTLTRLVSTYFEHSENTTNMCLLLHQSVYRARALYAPIHNLLEVLPQNSHSYTLSEPQCGWAYDVFVQFNTRENPFPCPDSHNFHEMRRCFSQLKLQLDRRLSKSRSKVRLLRHTTSGPALCLIGTVVAAAIAGVVITTHALIAIVAAPCFTAHHPRELTKKETAHIAQLDAAAMCSYILNNDLGTIDRLVARLYSHIEGDKFLIRLGLEKGRERHPIEEVLKQLHKNHVNINQQLKELEEHLCICFNTVNKTRSRLLEEMKFGKQKRHRRAVRFYTTCFGFREPFKVLCDGTFIYNLVKHRVAPADEAISNALGGPVKLFTTRCIIAELERLGNSHSSALDAAQMLAIARCDHDEKTSGSNCISQIIGENNPEHFFLATNDSILRQEFRKVPGVPRIFCLRNSLFLEKLSEFELKFVKNSEEERLHMAESEFNMLKKRAVNASITKERKDSSDEGQGLVDEKSKMHDIKVRHAEIKGMNVKEKIQFKRKKAKGPNPLSCKKKKSHGIPNPVSEKKSKGGENTASRSRKRKRSNKGNKLVESNG